MVVPLLVLIVLMLGLLLGGGVGLVVALAIVGLVASALAGIGWLIAYIVGVLFVIGIMSEARERGSHPRLTEAERMKLGGWSNAQSAKFLAILYGGTALLIVGSWLLSNAMK